MVQYLTQLVGLRPSNGVWLYSFLLLILNLKSYQLSLRLVQNFLTHLCLHFLTLTHQNILGSLLALNIKRETIGDILPEESVFYIISELDSFILQEFTSIGNSPIVLEQIDGRFIKRTETLEENTAWADRYLMINGSSLTWTTTSANASNFMLADATDLFDMEIASGSDFNPLNVTYQPNATADIIFCSMIEISSFV